METAFFSCVGRIYRRGRKFLISVLKMNLWFVFRVFMCYTSGIKYVSF